MKVKVKIKKNEFEITHKLILGKSYKLKKPEKITTYQVYSLDEEGNTFDLLDSFESLDEALKFAKKNNFDIIIEGE